MADEFNDGWDENLMGDEEDRKRLEMMSEKEREEEIFKRAEKREMEKKRFEIEKKLKLQRRKTKEETKQVNKALDTKERSRARKEAVESKRDKKSLALDVLKAKRKEKQELQAKKVRRTAMLLLVTRGMRFSNTNPAIQHYVMLYSLQIAYSEANFIYELFKQFFGDETFWSAPCSRRRRSSKSFRNISSLP